MSHADASNETLLSLNVSDALKVGAIENNLAVATAKPHGLRLLRIELILKSP